MISNRGRFPAAMSPFRALAIFAAAKRRPADSQRMSGRQVEHVGSPNADRQHCRHQKEKANEQTPVAHSAPHRILPP
jgi:hypothetical protein